ncbi:VOC family protein [Kribbella sp. NPDC026611]|uniref:VOC family protein n=1 Tax=Kribbella sp. NPDC026611 TaxID=3154911 RepID=UPI0033D10FC2
MYPVIAALAIDCLDPARVAAFWQALLGGELRRNPSQDDVLYELRGGAIRLDFAGVSEGKQTVKNRLHLDLYVRPETKEQAIDTALELGASRADDIYDGPLWQVMRDPEGNEFCFVWGAEGSAEG